jgi:hypothetical protein
MWTSLTFESKNLARRLSTKLKPTNPKKRLLDHPRKNYISKENKENKEKEVQV